MKKKYFLIILLFSLFFIPYKSNALSFNVMTGSYSLVNSCSSSSCSFSPNMAASRIRFFDTINHTQGSTVTYSLEFNVVSSYDDLKPEVCDIFNASTNQTWGGNNNFLRTYNAQYGSNRWYASMTFINVRSYSSSNSSNIFVECQMNVSSLIYSVSATSTTSSTSTGSGNNNQDIINNNNQNTHIIINNDNRNTQEIINSQNETTDAINDLNDTLQETTIDDETIGDKVGDIDKISDTPITDLLTMPLVLLNKLYTGMSGSCSTYTLGTLFNHTISLPCINGQQIFGSTVWTIIDGLFVIFMLYNIGMMVVHFFEKVSSLNDTFDDMYIPQHAKGGGK